MGLELTSTEEALLLAVYFRGGNPGDDAVWVSNSDQILTLSLFYTQDISADECAQRFSIKSNVQKLYNNNDLSDELELTEEIENRYQILIKLLRDHPALIQGGGDWKLPADPTFTSCRLTRFGLRHVLKLFSQFPGKPDFPAWHDKRTLPESE